MTQVFRGRVDIDGPPFDLEELEQRFDREDDAELARLESSLPAPIHDTLPAVIREPGGDVGKSKKEEPRIRAVKGLNGFSAATPFDAELMAEIGFGREVELTVHQERSAVHHRKYWAVLKTLCDNSEGKYLSPVDMHEALKISLGVTRRIQLLTPSTHATIAVKIRTRLAQCLMWIGGALDKVPFASKITDLIRESIVDLTALETECATILLPGSTGFWAMDQVAFKKYFDGAMDQLRQAGYPVNDALEYSNKQIGTKYRPVGQGGNHVLEQAAGPEPTIGATDRDDGAHRHLSLQEHGGQAQGSGSSESGTPF